jgi:hypothetical protein
VGPGSSPGQALDQVRGRLSLEKALIPVFDFPGFELPGREIFHPPLHPAVRRPVAETRHVLDHGRDDARHDPTPLLPRRLADHIDEFGLVGHCRSSRKFRAFLRRQVCSQLLNDFLRWRLDVEGRGDGFPNLCLRR